MKVIKEILKGIAVDLLVVGFIIGDLVFWIIDGIGRVFRKLFRL